MWTQGLKAWYAERGRHELPWRQTRDPWAVLVSEVMLQQTQVSRVLPRFAPFLDRWPAPAALAATPLPDVLREWRGMGYPRRARDLHRTATLIGAEGWPPDEAGLRRLPGVGAYTARALLVLAFGKSGPLPRDVNIGRVAARAALAVEPGEVAPSALDAAIAAGRPRGMSSRDYTLALFDAGALGCRARPRCAACPLARQCRSRARLAGAPRPPARRQGPYRGSRRELRGVVLAAMVGADPPTTVARLEQAVAATAAMHAPGAVGDALEGLVAEGLLAPLH